jgi:hypothetical protein
MTPEQIIAVYALGQAARTALTTSVGTVVQRANWFKAIGICDKMLADQGYPGHTQVLELMDEHWR